jgi:hypothetical protein
MKKIVETGITSRYRRSGGWRNLPTDAKRGVSGGISNT